MPSRHRKETEPSSAARRQRSARGGGWESNPPGIFRPLNGFEVRWLPSVCCYRVPVRAALYGAPWRVVRLVLMSAVCYREVR